MWPSSWVRTLFFNPTQPDGQDPKPSPGARASELVQGSSSDRSDHSSQLVEQNSWFNPRIDRSTRDFCMSRNSGWVLDEQIYLFDSIRRSHDCVQSNPSDKNPNPTNPLGQKGYVQPCPNLGLDGRPSSGSTQPDGYSTVKNKIKNKMRNFESNDIEQNKSNRQLNLFVRDVDYKPSI